MQYQNKDVSDCLFHSVVWSQSVNLRTDSTLPTRSSYPCEVFTVVQAMGKGKGHPITGLKVLEGE
jgi:hypothetical protein